MQIHNKGPFRLRGSKSEKGQRTRRQDQGKVDNFCTLGRARFDVTLQFDVALQF